MNRITHQKYQGGLYGPDGFLLQWHITERHNLRCAHCFQDGCGGDELRFQDLLEIVHLLGGNCS